VPKSLARCIFVACSCAALTCGLAPPSKITSDPDESTPAPRAQTWNELLAGWNSLRGDPYPLDPVTRSLDAGQRIRCDPHPLVAYKGKAVRYRSTVWINPAFRDRLERFEGIVDDVATEIYGRAPLWLDHFGAYNCRSTRHHTGRLSEHALGNALDVAGFDFGPAPRGQAVPPDLPRALRSPFQVRIGRHWQPDAARPTSAINSLHARFLHELALRCEQSGVFRVMIGPSQRDHTDHFHFDMSPWHYVNF
jgi:hypothetical protein